MSVEDFSLGFLLEERKYCFSEYSPSVVQSWDSPSHVNSFLYSSSQGILPLKFYVNNMASIIGEDVPCNATDCIQKCQFSDAITGELDL